MALKAFRKFGDSKAAKAMLLLLVVSFGAWGIGDYLVKQVGNDAVTVNGEGLSATEVERLYQGRVEQVQKLMGGRIDPATLAQLNVPAMVLQEAVSRAVMRQAASELRFYPATSAVRNEIVTTPDFIVGGKFDPKRYQDAVARVGLTTAAFEKSIGQDLSVRLLGALAQIAKLDGKTVSSLAALEGATTRLTAIKLTPALLPAMAPLGDEELKAFLHDNQQVFAVPERRTLRVMRLDPAGVMKTLTLDPADVQAAYDANPKAFALPEKRRVRHLLVADKAAAEAAKAEIKTLADLARVAAAQSLDPGSKDKGGDLGVITEEEMVPAFAKAAFGLGAGEISAPVETAFGWHIIGVESIEPAREPAFAEVKGRIETELKAQEAEQAVFDLQNTADDRLAGGDKLEVIAKDLGLKTEQWVRLKGNDEYANKGLLAAGFATEAGEVSTPVELEGGGVGYVEVEEVIPAEVPLLGDIKADVKAMAEAARVQKAMDDLGVAVLKATAGGGADWQSKVVAAAKGGEVLNVAPATLDDVPNWLAPGWADVGRLPVGGALPTVLADNEDRYVVQVASRTLATPDDKALTQNAGALRQRMQQDYEALLIEELMRQAEVETNDARLRQIFGQTTQVQ